MELKHDFPVDAIKVLLRQRKVYPDDSTLLQSMKEHGLINPIVLNRTDSSLVAGERRLRAARKLGWLTIAVTFRDELDPLTAQQIELEENLCRADLTDEEKVNAVRAVDTLYKQKAGGENWTLADTGEALGMSKTNTGVYIQVAEAKDKHPEVAAALHKQGIYGAYKTLQEVQSRQALAILAERNTGTSSDSSISLRNIDCLLGIKDIPDGSINLVMSDPPYAMGIDKANLWGMFTGKIQFDDGFKSTVDLIKALAPEVHRVLKKDAWFFYWINFDNYDVYAAIMEAAGFKVAWVPFIWVKEQLPPCSDLAHVFANSVEYGLYGWKGNPQLIKQGRTNVISCPPPAQKLHPFEKPVGLQAELINRFCTPGSQVLDLFTGSGSIPKACIISGMKWTAFEKDTAYYQIAKESIEREAANTARIQNLPLGEGVTEVI